MRKKLTALLLACLLLVCLVLPVSAADAPALYGTANVADGTVTVTLSLRGGSAVRSGAFTLSYDSSLTLSKTEKGLPLAVANTKEKGKVVCNWVGGAAEADQAVLTLTFTNAATKSYTFKVSGAKVTDKNYETTKIADFPIGIYVACNGKNCPSKSYKDVDQTQWYHNAVDYVLGNDLMKGTGKTTFSPDATLTRGMVVTVLGRAAGVKTSDYTGTSFSDVKAGSWYAPYVQWASKQGLVKGYEDGTFKPEQNVTREEMVTMLFRCWQSEGNTWKTDVAALNAYKDSAKVSSWALPAMRWAAANGVVNGVGGGKFEPDGNVTREQIATILYRYAGLRGVPTGGRADLGSFPDGGAVSGWAYDALSWANAAGLIAGTREGGVDYLAPQQNATRAQVAVILMRYLGAA